jgi:hypothetical protein
MLGSEWRVLAVVGVRADPSDLLCLQLASYSQRTMNDDASLLCIYKKELGIVGLDESGKEKAKLHGLGLLASYCHVLTWGSPLCSHSLLSMY